MHDDSIGASAPCDVPAIPVAAPRGTSSINNINKNDFSYTAMRLYKGIETGVIVVTLCVCRRLRIAAGAFIFCHRYF